MTTEAQTEWQGPLFAIPLPVGGFVEPIDDSTIFMYRKAESEGGFDMQEALYARTAPPGYKIECDEANQRWRHVESGDGG